MLMDTNEWDDIEYLLLLADTSSSGLSLCSLTMRPVVQLEGTTGRVSLLFHRVNGQKVEVGPIGTT